MKACDDRMDMLLLDVHGEMAPGDRVSWERHLEACPGCRGERQKLLALIERIQMGTRSPELTVAETTALTRSISGALEAETERAGWWRLRFGVRLPAIPALAAACLLVVAVGWFGFGQRLAPPAPGIQPKLGLEERMIVRDLDMLENMELLQDMDIIQRLAQIVDEQDPA
jgi:anti-sigma factor RsiW